MDAYREAALPPAITGTLMHLSERHRVAFYVRDGVSYVAEFREGRGELTDATSWFRVNAGTLRYCHGRAGALQNKAVLAPEIVEEIEHLHRQVDARDARIIEISTAVLATVQRCCTDIAARIRGSSAKRTQPG